MCFIIISNKSFGKNLAIIGALENVCGEGLRLRFVEKEHVVHVD